MRTLSKSKLMAYRQCPRRLWLEVHRPELRHDSAATQARYAAGHQVGDIARRLYDPVGEGSLIDVQAAGLEAAFARTGGSYSRRIRYLKPVSAPRGRWPLLTSCCRFRRAASWLGAHHLPAYFLDFETIQFAVPIWKGTRPYQQIPFQFSLHRLSSTGELEQQAFLELSGADPSSAFAAALIAACGEQGPIFVYNAVFETARIRELAERFPALARPLLALNERVVDLLPVAREHYYHPEQHGSWSIKAVLPALWMAAWPWKPIWKPRLRRPVMHARPKSNGSCWPTAR